MGWVYGEPQRLGWQIQAHTVSRIILTDWASLEWNLGAFLAGKDVIIRPPFSATSPHFRVQVFHSVELASESLLATPQTLTLVSFLSVIAFSPALIAVEP